MRGRLRLTSHVFSHRPPRCCGLTLLEVLVTVGLMALVVSVVAIRLAGVGPEGSLRRGATLVRTLDSRARLFARTLGPTRMALDADGSRLEIHLVDTGELLRRTDLPEGVRAGLSTDRRVSEVHFDRLGASLDYQVVLRAGTSSRSFTQLGLSGWSLEEGA